MLKFNPQTYTDWKDRNITTVSIELIPLGCEGTSLKIHENTVLENYKLLETIETIAVYADLKDTITLKDAYITRTGNKWIMKSSAIITRCGCGKSFGVATGNTKKDKILILKSLLSKKTGIKNA